MANLEISATRYGRLTGDVSLVTLEKIEGLAKKVLQIQTVVPNAPLIFELNQLTRGFFAFTAKLPLHDQDPLRARFVSTEEDLKVFFNDEFYLVGVETEIEATRALLELTLQMFVETVETFKARLDQAKNLSAIVYLSEESRDRLLDAYGVAAALFEEKLDTSFVS